MTQDQRDSVPNRRPRITESDAENMGLHLRRRYPPLLVIGGIALIYLLVKR